MPLPFVVGLLLLALSVAQMFRAVCRFKANKGSGMGQDITFSYDYLLFMLIALPGA